MIPATILALLSIASVSQAAAAPKILSSDDIIVLKTDGTSQVMKAADLEALETAPAVKNIAGSAKKDIQRRDCEDSTEIQVLSDKEFVNWDVAMSPVISSLGGSKATVSVTNGYTITNSLKVGASFSIPLIKDILTTSLSIDYTETWSSSQTQSLSFTVPEGHHGIIVSQPYVRRIEGNVIDGCTGDAKEGFVSDSYESQAYGNLQWVKGIIRLCSSETYPIPYCNGEGEHK
ncbi:unnamed protein product [Fusarium graminearum]|uniref:Chromosome 3, complete genome n=2 Tax=Gibberella zeae TaxID=5518 RepID=I1S2P6_GIBZE|nr:hypothetical protein FGSG_11046 [Fusarium graminearum PH-1]EYB29026.1 hypothetical protein FG05_11046 [Fusarium graminearum]ESU17691.1 hypothetical protein FGSG_11046 [Fusarium graminearum PH-1]KAI6768525.1 hypothetical protein HG531_010714 [Fusarium graminearum]PCD36658.1 hypothetical protein FGRA07_07662 [Fusarium graminearum]CAF3485704.1 unnamed protein product [Fusarium graminearum]|eukprot:XP_011325313.1 hypothetical protein FGSG_11046 [Fusarium graminearum PH-1]